MKHPNEGELGSEDANTNKPKDSSTESSKLKRQKTAPLKKGVKRSGYQAPEQGSGVREVFIQALACPEQGLLPVSHIYSL